MSPTGEAFKAIWRPYITFIGASVTSGITNTIASFVLGFIPFIGLVFKIPFLGTFLTAYISSFLTIPHAIKAYVESNRKCIS